MNTLSASTLRLVPLLMLLTLLLWSRPARAQDPSVGLLSQASGKVMVVRTGVTIDARNRFHLQVGDHVRLAAGADAEVMHLTGGKLYRLRPGSDALVEQNRLSINGKEATVIGHFAATALPAARHGSILGIFMRGSSDDLNTPDPYGSFAGTDVTLTWKNQIPAAERVPLVVTLRRDGELDPFFSMPVSATATRFRIPAGTIDSDTVYFWQVATAKGSATYQIQGVLWQMTPEEVSRVHAAKSDAAKLRKSAPKSPAADLLLATVYENVGLYRRALVAYRAARKFSGDPTAYAADIDQLAKVLEK